MAFIYICHVYHTGYIVSTSWELAFSLAHQDQEVGLGRLVGLRRKLKLIELSTAHDLSIMVYLQRVGWLIDCMVALRATELPRCSGT